MFTAIIDTREQLPLTLEYSPGQVLPSQPGKLYTGDYSIKGLEHHIAIERKSLDDLTACIGNERERFEKELLRLRSYPVRALVIESSWAMIEAGAYRSRVHPSSAVGSLCGWIADGLPVIMADDHKRAGVIVARMLWITASRRLKEIKSLER